MQPFELINFPFKLQVRIEYENYSIPDLDYKSKQSWKKTELVVRTLGNCYCDYWHFIKERSSFGAQGNGVLWYLNDEGEFEQKKITNINGVSAIRLLDWETITFHFSKKTDMSVCKLLM